MPRAARSRPTSNRSISGRRPSRFSRSRSSRSSCSRDFLCACRGTRCLPTEERDRCIEPAAVVCLLHLAERLQLVRHRRPSASPVRAALSRGALPRQRSPFCVFPLRATRHRHRARGGGAHRRATRSSFRSAGCRAPRSPGHAERSGHERKLQRRFVVFEALLEHLQPMVTVAVDREPKDALYQGGIHLMHALPFDRPGLAHAILVAAHDFTRLVS